MQAPAKKPAEVNPASAIKHQQSLEANCCLGISRCPLLHLLT